MKHRRTRKRFRHAPPRYRYRAAVVSVAFLAVASSTGMLLSHAQRPPETNGSQALTAVSTSPASMSHGPTSEVSRGNTKAPPPKTKRAPAPSPTQPPAGSRAAPPSRPGVAPHPTPPPAAPRSAPATVPSKVLNYQFQWQENFYYCGPAAMRIALTARGVYRSQRDLAGPLGTTVNGTRSADDTTRVLNQITGTSFYKSRFIPGEAATPGEADQLRADLVHAIGNGFAVVANITGTATDRDGDVHSYPDGHYVAAIGYSDNGANVKIADSADARGHGSYWIPTSALADWVARRGYSS